MRRRNSIAWAGLAVIAALAVVMTVPVDRAVAGGGCARLGDKPPKKLTKPQARRAVKCLINKKRAKHGLRSLKRHKALQRAAQRHSNRMEDSGCFSHQCSGEGSLDARLRSTGYISGARSWRYSENIAWGKGRRATPRAIVRAWMRSSGHRANILGSSFRHIGVGFAKGTPYRKGDNNGGLYTVDFGRRG